MAIAEDLKFLVVEDHPFQRSMQLRMLRKLGARDPLQASEGAQALDVLAAEGDIDVVLCDLKMPGMDGLEFIRHVGLTRPGLSLIIVSALERSLLNSVEKMTRAYGGRLLGVIEKPVTARALEALLANHQAPVAGRVSGPRFRLKTSWKASANASSSRSSSRRSTSAPTPS